MKPFRSSDQDEQDEKIIRLLNKLGSVESKYPADLLGARRAAFLAQVEQLSPAELGEETPADAQGIVRLLGVLKSAETEYPPDLLAARRAAFLQQLETAGGISVLDRLRASLRRIFSSEPMAPAFPAPGFRRISLVIAALLAAVVIGSLLLPGAGPSLQLSPAKATVEPTYVHPTGMMNEVTITICKPDDQTPSCLPGELDPGEDLADPVNGEARPAVSKDARPKAADVHGAANVNDGRSGASWVSNSADSWIKIDLGSVSTVNTVSLQKGSVGSPEENDPGQFVIAVALSDFYADGDSSNDHAEYAQVFRSEQVGFSGRVSHIDTIRTRFSPVEARFVKITFENAGAAIQEVGVFMIRPPVLAEQPTRTPQDDQPTLTLTLMNTTTLTAAVTATSAPTSTRPRTQTVVPLVPSTPPSSDTPVPLSTNTRPPTDTSTPLPLEPAPSNSPVPSPAITLPTAIPTTAVPPILQLPPVISSDPIVVTGNGQTLIFTCNGNEVEMRGHANTVTLLGSCSSITVTGNGNRVFWQSGSPVITDRGNDNLIQQQ